MHLYIESARYDVEAQFLGSVAYHPTLYNTVWTAETICSIAGETAIADIGPPESDSPKHDSNHHNPLFSSQSNQPQSLGFILPHIPQTISDIFY